MQLHPVLPEKSHKNRTPANWDDIKDRCSCCEVSHCFMKLCYVSTLPSLVFWSWMLQSRGKSDQEAHRLVTCLSEVINIGSSSFLSVSLTFCSLLPKTSNLVHKPIRKSFTVVTADSRFLIGVYRSNHSYHPLVAVKENATLRLQCLHLLHCLWPDKWTIFTPLQRLLSSVGPWLKGKH